MSGAVFSHAWTCLLNLVPYENRKKNLSLSLSVYLIAKRTNMYILLCVRIFFFCLLLPLPNSLPSSLGACFSYLVLSFAFEVVFCSSAKCAGLSQHTRNAHAAKPTHMSTSSATHSLDHIHTAHTHLYGIRMRFFCSPVKRIAFPCVCVLCVSCGCGFSNISRFIPNRKNNIIIIKSVIVV